MPSPVEALPCGSRSRMRTVSPMAASAVPRLMAVVVLPTPPFWLAIARTRGCRTGAGADHTFSDSWITSESELHLARGIAGIAGHGRGLTLDAFLLCPCPKHARPCGPQQSAPWNRSYSVRD